MTRIDESLSAALRNASNRANASQKVATGLAPTPTPEGLPAFPPRGEASQVEGFHSRRGRAARTWEGRQGSD